jgi:hypothetical protein
VLLISRGYPAKKPRNAGKGPKAPFCFIMHSFMISQVLLEQFINSVEGRISVLVLNEELEDGVQY